MFSNSSSKEFKGRVTGLKRGIVKEIKDPDKLNRVKVTLTDEALELPYTDVVVPFNGKKAGTVFVPQKGDEVILGFVDGNLSNPIILGNVYNSKTKPPLAINDKNEIMLIQFPAGLKIEIDNKKNKQKVTITTKKGHVVSIDDDKEQAKIMNKKGKTGLTIDFKKGKVEVLAEKAISFKAGKESMALEDGKGLTLKSAQGKLKVDVNEVAMKAKSNVKLQANANAEIKANAKASLKGSAGAELNSTGQTVVKGSITRIN